MATWTKFQDFVEQLGLAKHNLNTDTIMAMLTLNAPVNTNTIRSNLTEIAAGNGYTTGGIDIQNTWAESSGTATLTATKVVWTASGAMASFQYVVLYNDTQTSPVDPLVLFSNYGSSLALASGETFSVKFNASETTGSVATLA